MVQPTIEETCLSTEQAITTYRQGARITDVDSLVVEGLSVYYETEAGTVKAVDDVSFTLKQGERFALVGESGSGKTTLAMALMRLTRPPGHIARGSVTLNNRDLTTLTEDEMRQARLSELSLVPQGAMNSLNPVMRIERQLTDGIVDHLADDESITKEELSQTARDLLTRVGLRPEVARLYPHELSGGMKQRVAMAIGISLRPSLIIADEPTSALDVSVQAHILNLLQDLKDKFNLTYIFISHDLAVVEHLADWVAVMYLGRLIEFGSASEVLQNPLHPYTQALMESVLTPDPRKGLPEITFGRGLPNPLEPPSGCNFHPRCSKIIDGCDSKMPKLLPESDRLVECHLYN